MAFEHALVLTGGIATGKSTVAKIFSEYGLAVIDADRVAHQVLDAQHAKIAEMFGAALVVDKKVQRKALGAIIFANEVERKRLEALLHPLIYAEIVRQASSLERELKSYIVDIPLFFEGGRYPIERSLVVYATQAQQRERLMQREGCSLEDTTRRIAAQMDIEEKRKRATYLIDNRGDIKALQGECDKILEKIESEFRRF